MAIRKSAQALQRAPAQSPLEAAGVYSMVSEYTVEATLAAGDIIEMGVLPANCILTGHPTLSCDKLDTGTTLTLDVGLMTGQYLNALDDAGAARVCGQELFAGTTAGQAASSVASTSVTALRLTPAIVDRSFGIKVATGAAGNVAGAKIRFIANFTNAPVGI